MLGPLRHVGSGSRSVGPRNFQPRQYPEDVVDVGVPNSRVINVVDSQSHGRIECVRHMSNDEEVDEVSLMNETAGGRGKSRSHTASVEDALRINADVNRSEMSGARGQTPSPAGVSEGGLEPPCPVKGTSTSS